MKTFFIQIIALIIAFFTILIFVFNPSLLDRILPQGSLRLFSSPLVNSPSDQNQNINSDKATVRIIDGSSNTNLVIVKAIVNADVSDERQERARGLAGMDSIASDSGMLFVFEQADKHRFWMKGLKFPLDFIWILDDRVVDILVNVPNPDPNTPDDQLPVYGPTTKVNRVLEVNAGFVERHNIRVGDKIQLLGE